MSGKVVTSVTPSGCFANCLPVTENLPFQVLFIPLHMLLTAKEAAELFLKHVVRRPALPRYLGSHQDPRFTSCFRGEFRSLLCTSVYVSSGFYLRLESSSTTGPLSFQSPYG